MFIVSYDPKYLSSVLFAQRKAFTVLTVDTSAKREGNICIRIKLSVYLLGISRSMFTSQQCKLYKRECRDVELRGRE